MLIAFITLFLFLAYKKQLFTVILKDFFGILGVGALVTFHWLCFFQSIKVSTISVAVVCLATSSLFSALIEPMFFKRKLLKLLSLDVEEADRWLLVDLALSPLALPAGAFCIRVLNKCVDFL